ncbi:hypothetical protein C9E91_01590 [Rhizobium sp. SEMIA4064]|nr:hypothetical protein C9E91_01590 [Rhizobium sp. SEMIA4064]
MFVLAQTMPFGRMHWLATKKRKLEFPAFEQFAPRNQSSIDKSYLSMMIGRIKCFTAIGSDYPLRFFVKKLCNKYIALSLE